MKIFFVTGVINAKGEPYETTVSIDTDNPKEFTYLLWLEFSQAIQRGWDARLMISNRSEEDWK